MNLIQIIVLAMIQGAAELLPVSSSAHVIVAEKLMGLDPSAPEMTFLLVMLHTGTMFAVLFYFWPRWKPLLSGKAGGAFVKNILLATAITGVVGLSLKKLIERFVVSEVEHLFRILPLVGGALFAVGLLILWAGSHETSAKKGQLTPRVAAWIGIVQGLCLPFRGFSRSGATISTG